MTLQFHCVSDRLGTATFRAQFNTCVQKNKMFFLNFLDVITSNERVKLIFLILVYINLLKLTTKTM